MLQRHIFIQQAKYIQTARVCYSVNLYKPLQNRLLQKLLQTVTNSYKPVTNQLLREPLQTVTNYYKPLQIIYSINRYEPLHYQSDTTV